MLEELLPDRASVRLVFEAAGFQMAASDTITQTVAPSWAAYAEELSAGGDSVLARLRRQELEAGLAAVRSHVTDVDDQAVVELIDAFVFFGSGQGARRHEQLEPSAGHVV
jgi:hypothetical protein